MADKPIDNTKRSEALSKKLPRPNINVDNPVK